MYKTIGKTHVRAYLISTILDHNQYATAIWHRYYKRPVVVAYTYTRESAIATHKNWVRYCASSPKQAFDIEIHKEMPLC